MKPSFPLYIAAMWYRFVARAYIKRFLISILLLIASVASANDAKKLTPNETKQLLDQIGEQQPQTALKIAFRETRTSTLFKAPLRSEGMLYFNPPNQFRKENTSSPQSTIVSDGKTLWMYYPAFKEVETYSLQAKTPIAAQLSNFLACLDLKKAQHQFNIEAWKTSYGYKLSLAPKHRKPYFDATVHVELNDALRPIVFILQTRSGDTTRVEFKTESPFTPPPNFFSF